MLVIEYTLFGIGWAKCVVRDAQNNVTLTASYLSDALGSLLSGVLALTKGERESVVIFEEEPGEYVWRFKVVSPEQVSVEIFDGAMTGNADEGRTKVFETTCSLVELVKAVVTASSTLLEVEGESGYHQKWKEHEFPIQHNKELLEWTSTYQN